MNPANASGRSVHTWRMQRRFCCGLHFGSMLVFLAVSGCHSSEPRVAQERTPPPAQSTRPQPDDDLAAVLQLHPRIDRPRNQMGHSSATVFSFTQKTRTVLALLPGKGERFGPIMILKNGKPLGSRIDWRTPHGLRIMIDDWQGVEHVPEGECVMEIDGDHRPKGQRLSD